MLLRTRMGIKKLLTTVMKLRFTFRIARTGSAKSRLLILPVKSVVVLILTFLALSTTAQTPDANHIVFVIPDGTGDGSSWSAATGDLHAAIHATGVQKVFVAIGNYNVGSNSFAMKKNVEIYGGFDPANNVKTLNDARILPNKGLSEGSVLNGENVRPVIWNVFTAGTALDNTAVLDGFTIKNGSSTTEGGGIRNVYSSAVFRNLVIKNNLAKSGGGIFISGSSPHIVNSIIQNNTVTEYAGGVHSTGSSSARITNVIIKGNTSTYTGAGFLNTQSSSPILTNVLFIGNLATSFNAAHGAYTSSGYVELRNVTIAGNVPGDYGTSYALRTNGGSFGVHNSIVFGEIDGNNISSRNSLIEGYSDVANGNLDATGISPADIFTNPSGGDYTLKVGSPAVDKGDEDLYEGLAENTTDLAGNARVYQFNGGVIDLGAYESSHSAFPYTALSPDAQGIIYVRQTAVGSKNGSSWANATDKLNKAIHINEVQQVWAAVGTYPRKNIGLKKNVALYGGFDPDNLIDDLTDMRILPQPDLNIAGSVIDAQHMGAVVSNNNNGADHTAVLDGFTLTNGQNATGGGIYNNGASPTLRNLWIKQNTGVSDGGGMYNHNFSSPVMSNVTISNNSASYGGGVFNRKNSSPVMTNVRIKANNAAEAGGGMYNDDSASPLLTNVAITGNSTKNGAGMYNRTNSSPTIINTQFTGNTATSNGGAIRNESASSPNLIQVTIADNSGANALYATGGSTSLTNSLVYGQINGTYTAQYSLIEGKIDTQNGNLDATGITKADVFTDAQTSDYTLNPCSPATNAGMQDVSGLSLPSMDLGGNARVFADRVDMGAYENVTLPANPGIAQSSSITNRHQLSNGTVGYYNQCNELLVSITTSGQAGDISGNTVAKIWIEDEQPAQYVRRHFEITPADDAESVSGKVTLYFTQADFDAFNIANPSIPLPDGPTGSITNLLVEKRGGTSSDGSGAPNKYPGTPENASDVQVTWNAAASRWEVSFYVTGFSGFFVKTTLSPLPVRWLSFSARLNDDQRGVLDWEVDQNNVAEYQIQRSNNASDFRTIGKILAKGEGINRYSFTDPVPATGMVYYRIRQTDLDGTYTYSRIINVSGTQGIQLIAYPNPVRDKLTVQIGAEYVGTPLRLVSMSGIPLQQLTAREEIFTLNLGKYPEGIYMLYTWDGRGIKLVKN
jgi:hypothetical protein